MSVPLIHGCSAAYNHAAQQLSITYITAGNTIMDQFGQLKPSPRILLGPGPSDVHPRVLTAMATPLVGHLDPQFLEIMNETQLLLRAVFRTENRLTFPVSGTGSAGMEACVVNLIEPGDR